MNMNMIHLSPAAEINRLQKDMDRFFERTTPWLPSFSKLSGMAPVDMYESDGKLHIEAELPKFNEDEIKIEQVDNHINISAEHTDTQRNKGKYIFQESRNTLYRSVTLPDNIDLEKPNVTFKNGVLDVTYPLTKTTQPKKLKISTGK